MDFAPNINEDDESAVSSMGSDEDASVEVKNDETKLLPWEDWKYIPGMSRNDVLKNICNNKTSDELTLVQIVQRGDTPHDSLKHMFLIIPEILTKGEHFIVFA